jgi:putative ABC transport system permease protein
MRGIYKIWDVVRLGLHSLAVHKVRSFLTMLGIIFGVCSVIIMLAINEGSSYESQLVFRELGSDNIILTAVKPAADDSKASAQKGGILSYGLTGDDVDRLRGNVPNLVRCVTVRRTPNDASVGAKRESIDVFATEPDFAKVARIEMADGRFITHADMLPPSKANCVLAQPLAKRLFPCEDPLGKPLYLGSQPFTVVGILRRLPAALAGEASTSGNYAVIPLAADRDRFGMYATRVAPGNITLERLELTQIILQMEDERAVVEGAGIARSLLARYHDKPDYYVKVPVELLEQRRKQDAIWNFMFAMIASVSLVVGGIGIMNIMLASITERTREIGIRRALGGKRRDIMVQFLVESVTLTMVGGLVGIGVGVLAPWAVQTFLNKRTIVTAFTLVLPLVMSVAVGLVSGLYPAYRAAKLDPIVALRHE